MIILVILAIIFIAWLIIKPYVIKHDTVTLYVGGLGSGKTLVGVQDALRCLKRNRLKVFWYNLTHKNKKQKPLLYSTIPVRVSSREMSVDLTEKHLLMEQHIVEKSVLFIDEISTVANAFETVANNLNLHSFEEFCTFFRHFTKSGFLIATTQNTSKCSYVARYCCNQAFQLSQFVNFLGLFYIVKCRNIDLTNDVVNINNANVEDNTRNLFGFFGSRKYDTHCFSERYADVPYKDEQRSSETLKRNTFARIPRKSPKEAKK